MADIALVHLAIDSSAVKSGADQSVKALKSVETSMSSASTKVVEGNKKIADSAKHTGEVMEKAGKGAAVMSSELNKLGGNVGSVAAQLGPLGNALDEVQAYIGAYGAGGGLVVGAVAGVTALAGAFVNLTLAGVEVSDQLGDIAEETGFSLDTISRLAAAYRLSGEDIGSLTRAVKTFTSAVADAKDPTSDAAKALERIGTDAVTAGRDMETAFIKGAVQVKDLRETVEGAEASNLLYSKGVGALVRQQDNFVVVLGQSRDKLEAAGVVATLRAVEAGGKLDAQLKTLNNSWTVFTQNLAASTSGGILSAAIDDLNTRLKTSTGLIDGMIKLLGSISLSNIGQIVLNAGARAAPFRGTPPQSLFDEWRGGKQKTTSGISPGAPTAPKAPKAAGKSEAVKAEEEFQKARLAAAREGNKLMQDQFDKDIADLEKKYAGMMEAHKTSVEDARVEIGERVGKIAKGVPLAIGAAPGLGGLTPEAIGPAGKAIRTEAQARLDAEFGAIFDDFLFTILTAQGTLGDAFKGLATGILDTFAREMIASMQKDFIQPLAKGLTDLLRDALGGIFDGLGSGGGKGLSGFFGGVFKGIGKVFGGIFGGGGTLGPGKFGIAGERGPELIFSGSQPMHIAPVTAGSAGNVFNITIPVNAPAGTVDRRTQDQIAVSVLNAVKRAQRNEGSR